MDIKSLFSERALGSKDLSRTIVDTTDHELNLVKPFIDIFPDLVSVDYVNPQFLAYLGDFLGFDYLETEDSEVQREIMKRVVDEYHKKGSIKELYKVANRAYSDNYFLGDMTYYRGEIEEGYSAISFPRDRMFRYDYSKWDQNSVWGDNSRIMLGVMEVQMSKFNERTLTYLDKMVPGGIKFYIDILRDISGTDGIYKPVDPNAVLFPFEPGIMEASIYIEPPILAPYYRRKIFVFDRTQMDEYPFEGSERVVDKDIWDERPADAVAFNVILPSDMMMPVIHCIDDRCLYNLNRLKGYLDGKNDRWDSDDDKIDVVDPDTGEEYVYGDHFYRLDDDKLDGDRTDEWIEPDPPPKPERWEPMEQTTLDDTEIDEETVW